MAERTHPAAKKLADKLSSDQWGDPTWEYRREPCGTSEELEAVAVFKRPKEEETTWA